VKKQKKRVKHIPQRTCIACRETLSKKELMRIVRTPDHVQYDPTGKAPGRGAYLHNKQSCWERALGGSLARALKAEISREDKNILKEIIKDLPDEE
jgi:predicted RNA-binding protein YlxR (DUF448 family)